MRLAVCDNWIWFEKVCKSLVGQEFRRIVQLKPRILNEEFVLLGCWDRAAIAMVRLKRYQVERDEKGHERGAGFGPVLGVPGLRDWEASGLTSNACQSNMES